MAEYNRVNVKLSDSQFNELKMTVENQTGVTLRINFKMFNGQNLPDELLLTTRQTAEFRNAIENNTSTNIKLSRTLGMLLGTLGASLLGNMLSGKGIVREGYGNKEGKGILRAGYGSKGSSNTKILHHPIL